MEQNSLDKLIAKTKAAREWLRPAIDAFKDAYSEGREDYGMANRYGRERSEKDPSGARISTTVATNPMSFRTREAMGWADPSQVEVRNEMGMGLKSGRRERVGQILGTLGND